MQLLLLKSLCYNVTVDCNELNVTAADNMVCFGAFMLLVG